MIQHHNDASRKKVRPHAKIIAVCRCNPTIFAYLCCQEKNLCAFVAPLNRKIMNRLKVICVLCALCMGILASCAQELKTGDSLPTFALQSAANGNMSSADLKGKVVLVNLFATWCGPCQLELAEVQKTLWPKYKDNPDFCMLVVGREHTEEQLKAYNARKHFTFPLYPDPDRKFYAAFAGNYIPRAYLFNKEGKLVYTSVGYDAQEFETLMNTIQDLLK